MFGYIGRLVKQKNVGLIINSFNNLKKKTSKKIKLLIVGDGPEKQSLIDLTKTLNLSGDIRFIGHEYKVGEIIKLIDVFCMNTKFEGLGLVMLEVMYFGKPIIGPSVSAIPEVVENNVNGLIVKSENEDDYANAMLKLTDFKKKSFLSTECQKILNKKI